MPLTLLELNAAVTRARLALLAARVCQDSENIQNSHDSQGYWIGRLSSSPLATAVALVALDVDEIVSEKINQAFRWLHETQSLDGGWGDTPTSRSNLAATLLVLCADARHCDQGALKIQTRERAQNYVENLGGFEAGLRRVYGADLTFQTPIRMAAACVGLLPWRAVEALPLELATAPRSLMGLLGLPVVSYALPALVCVGLARHKKAPSKFIPLAALREKCVAPALAVVREMQPQSGGYLEAIPLTAFCRMALKAAGFGDHPIARDARRFLLKTQRSDGSWPVEVHLSIWNTTRAVEALKFSPENSFSTWDTEQTAAWLLSQQTREACVYSGAQPGGWGWNHCSGSVPDADDTAGALLALKQLSPNGASSVQAVEAGLEWLLRLQNSNGGWPTFCRGWEKLPFDRSAPDLTAHVLRAISAWKNSAESIVELRQRMEVASVAGWKYLAKQQRRDGSFAPLWFGCEHAPDQLNAAYGTCQVLLACAADVPRDIQLTERAIGYLEKLQNPDGSFGGTLGALGTVEETGLCLRALCAHGWNFSMPRAQAAARWLIECQRDDGSWDPAPIGFYFAVLWYHEELYPLCYALGGLSALYATGTE